MTAVGSDARIQAMARVTSSDEMRAQEQMIMGQNPNS